jgi:hypothetical protein
MTLDFTPAKDCIKNYSDSILAKKECNDCVVRAFAAAADWSYDAAHRFVSDEFGREPKKGTPRFKSTMAQLVNDKRRVNRKKLTTISDTEMKNGSSRMTVGQFVKFYDKGTFIIVISRHAFTIRDGVVIGGNREDSKRMRCIIKGVWKVG